MRENSTLNDEEAQRMRAQYETASAFYSWVMEGMSKHATAVSEFEAFQAVVAKARLEYERTKRALEEFEVRQNGGGRQ